MPAVRYFPLLPALGALACAHAPLPAQKNLGPADYCPLAVGNAWTYTSGEKDRTIKILSRSADGYFKDTDNAELRADPDCVHDRQRRLLCAPFSAGKGWVSVVSVSSTERYEIANADAMVSTPAGVFQHCVKVVAHNRSSADVDLVAEWSWAPGVGLVQFESYALVKGDMRPSVKFQLKSYHLAGMAEGGP